MSNQSHSGSTSAKQRIAVLTGLLGLIILYAIYSYSNRSAPSTAHEPQYGTVTPSAVISNRLPDWLTIYFTDPNPPDNEQNGIDRIVVAAIVEAQQSIDVTSFEFNLPSITSALINASQRGVQVRMVLDLVNGSELTDERTMEALAALNKAYIPIVDGGRDYGLMHNKMILIDGKILFMGSWNITYSETFRNNNNLLKITAPKLIANYQAKFNELFIDQRFGSESRVRAINPALNLSGVYVENYFAPPDGVMARLVKIVQTAKKSIRFMAFSYTDKNLSAAMIEREQAGVEVSGVIERNNVNQSVLATLFCARLPVKEDGNPYTMHHKVIIVDEEIVITGSFNFTKSADDANDENVLIIHSPVVAELYLQEFNRVYGIGIAPDPTHIDCSKVK